jgi:esterase/lipase superfamily enzyme
MKMAAGAARCADDDVWAESALEIPTEWEKRRRGLARHRSRRARAALALAAVAPFVILAGIWAGSGKSKAVHLTHGQRFGSGLFQYISTDDKGVALYMVASRNNGGDAEPVRALTPTNPAAGVPHNFLYVLPIESGLDSEYGDGLDTLRRLNAPNRYNVTIIEPAFASLPWIADNPTDPHRQYETFITDDLMPWAAGELSQTGREQNWIIGLSKAGMAAQDLLFKHPDLFAKVASWDHPAKDMTSYTEYGADNFGSQSYFRDNYQLSPANLDRWKAPFENENRIWIGGYQAFQQDLIDYDALLTSEGVKHTLGTMTSIPHRWDSGWMAAAMAYLGASSGNPPVVTAASARATTPRST